MTKLVFDSDGLIKLTKSRIIKKVLGNFDCYVSEEVNGECVIEGKDRLYEDAFQIDSFIRENKLKVMKVKTDPMVKKMLRDEKYLGNGEKSTLHLFFNIKGKAIITDDQAFLNLLHRNNIPFIIPTDLISRLVELRILEKRDAISALEKIRPLVKESNYLIAKKKVEVI